jgi:hypothetical protein
MKIDLDSLRACPNCGIVVDFTAICEPSKEEFSNVSTWVCPMCGISYDEGD